MAFPLPETLSPSKVSSFTDCALAFRFSAIDRLPEPPSLPAVRGSLVHAALERLFVLEAADRTPDRAQHCLDEAWAAFQTDTEFVGLDLDTETADEMLSAARTLVANEFLLEDPTAISPIGIEVMLEIELDGVRLRGIIDRLELDDDGELVVTDYKSGRAPSERFEQGRLVGVQFYAMLCEQLFGRRPARVQLVYLGGSSPEMIIHTPNDRATVNLERKLRAIWQAVERACEREDFRPNPGKLCDWCGFKAYCPAFGGDPASAVEMRPDPLVAVG
ncbi:MAG TPA: PD-(D/E)XK nuclease family protein [Acidimicrobiales bacterium]|nr:PD-(D/E)XK nuclease family protein [Acidimicrobiales bacterium]